MLTCSEDPRLLQAFDAVLAERGWAATGLAEVAGRAGVRLEHVYPRYGSRAALARALVRLADHAMLSDGDPEDAAAPVKDRLFDLVMRRLDALEPYRAAIAAISASPSAGAALAGPLARSMGRLLDAGGVDRRARRLLAWRLLAAYRRVVAVWLADDSPDRARTMAALDQSLEPLLRRG